MTSEKRRSKVPTVVAEQELALAHLGVALFGLVDGLRTDAGKAKREFSESRAQTVACYVRGICRWAAATVLRASGEP